MEGAQLKMKLDAVRKQRAEQANETEILQDLIPLLLSREDQDLLKRLHAGTNVQQATNHALRSR
jgi:hypothetical protein